MLYQLTCNLAWQDCRTRFSSARVVSHRSSGMFSVVSCLVPPSPAALCRLAKVGSCSNDDAGGGPLDGGPVGGGPDGGGPDGGGPAGGGPVRGGPPEVGSSDLDLPIGSARRDKQ